MDIKLKEVVNIKNDKYIDKDKDNSVLREEYTGRWTNLNIFTGALELRRMVEITKPDGEGFCYCYSVKLLRSKEWLRLPNPMERSSIVIISITIPLVPMSIYEFRFEYL